MFVESLQRDVERRRVEEFVERGFAPGVVPPFSFRYDG
ncbi:MAG: hypothetical protein JWQ45_625, partial [Blastococcus sp.]|nr:hypothetical protein [Blastococcus sp.]